MRILQSKHESSKVLEQYFSERQFGHICRWPRSLLAVTVFTLRSLVSCGHGKGVIGS